MELEYHSDKPQYIHIYSELDDTFGPVHASY